MSNSTLLIVDDELSMREFLQILLEKEGYNVLVGEGGEDALRIIASEPYDLMICDMKMPRVSGLEVLKKSKDRKSTRLNSSHIPLSRMPSSA